MDFSGIIAIIMAIITFIQQLISGGKPPVNPDPPVFPEYAQVSCAAPNWSGEQVFLDAHVQGQMTEDCTVVFKAIPLSGSSVVDRMTRTMDGQISQDGHQTDEVFDLSSNASVVKTFQSDFNVQGNYVSGQTKLTSDFQRAVNTAFTATSLPQTGDASYLKEVRTSTQVKQGADMDTFHFRFNTYSKVKRPLLAPAGRFKSALVDALKAKTDSAAKNALRELINNL
jgi:hypothetical protein